MTRGQKIGVFSAVILVIIGAAAAIFRYTNPGVYMKYNCDLGGDSTRKFYDPNWQARGAVCDGLWIPFGSQLNGKSYPAVLARMAHLISAATVLKPTNTVEMRDLATLAAQTA